MSGFQCEAKKLYPNEMFPKSLCLKNFVYLLKINAATLSAGEAGIENGWMLKIKDSDSTVLI